MAMWAPSFPADPKEALMIGFVNAEKKFMELCQNEYGIIDKSCQCRGFKSYFQGQKIIELSRDHKPNDDRERKRIIESGGQIYHRTATTNADAKDPSKKEIVVGPLRVLPGRISVSRIFGDAEAKSKNLEAIQIVDDNKQLGIAQNIHKQSGMAVEYILKNSLLRRTLDNVTILMIAFNNFKHTVFGQTKGKQQLKSKFVKGNSDHRSNENSLKENLISKKSKLGINTNTNCSAQGPATTTNAQLQRNFEKGITDETISFLSSNNQNQIIASKKLQVGLTTNNSISKHFDFSNARKIPQIVQLYFNQSRRYFKQGNTRIAYQRNSQQCSTSGSGVRCSTEGIERS
eukprot:403359647